MPTTTILIIHPRELIRLGLLSVLKDQGEYKVVGQGSNGKDAVKLTKQHGPDVVLLVDQLDSEDSFALAKKLVAASPSLKVVMIGVQENSTYMARDASAGVHDYLFEGSSPREIITTIKNTVSGKRPLASSSYGRIVASMKERGVNSSVDLTPREQQVLRHVGYGLSNDEIARSLEISLETTKEHVQNMLRKLEVRDRTQAAVWAVKQGLV